MCQCARLIVRTDTVSLFNNHTGTLRPMIWHIVDDPEELNLFSIVSASSSIAHGRVQVLASHFATRQTLIAISQEDALVRPSLAIADRTNYEASILEQPAVCKFVVVVQNVFLVKTSSLRDENIVRCRGIRGNWGWRHE
jgi:hypothetical protein